MLGTFLLALLLIPHCTFATSLSDLMPHIKPQISLWKKVGNGKYHCYGTFCKKVDYESSTFPSTNSTLHTNIVLALGESIKNGDLKEIDIHKMTIVYTPTVAIMWRDPRFRALANDTEWKEMDSEIWKAIWIPQLKISNIEASNTRPPCKSDQSYFYGIHTSYSLNLIRKFIWESRANLMNSISFFLQPFG